MDALVHSAVEEICAQGASGLTLPILWPKLRRKLAANGLNLCPFVKAALWTNLLDVPGLQFQGKGVPYSLERDLSTLNSVEICEQMNLTIVAPEQLRNNFVGIYDVDSSASSVTDVQLRTLERLAIAGTNGITQIELAKEFGIKSNNFFYVLKKLESRGLVVRQPTVIRTKETAIDMEPKNPSVVTTNMVYLYRYGKHLGCQQRLEITKEDNDDIADESSGCTEEFEKEDVKVKDFLPAYKTICDKLEEAEGKILVVSDIKRDLNYLGDHGHKAWRYICNKLIEAQIVEEFCAKVKNKEVSCLRLLKKLSLEHFEAISSLGSGNGYLDGDQFIKLGKRGQITEQLVELPIEQQIYDLIDSSYSNGLTITEVLRRLGLQNKQYYDRLLQFFPRCGMHLQAESHNKGVAYRVWTANHFNSVKTDDMILDISESLLDNNEVKDMEVAQELAEITQGVVDAPTSKDNGIVVYSLGVEPEGSNGSRTKRDQFNNIMVPVDDNSPNCDSEPSGSPCGVDVGTVFDVTSLQVSPGAVTTTTSRRRRSYQVYPCLSLSSANAQREQRILKMLEEEKFMLKAEIHRRLEDLEKEKDTRTDRKTLARILNKLKDEGLCDCIAFQVPVMTNIANRRITDVVLHPSIFGESQKILSDKILERIRSFDMLVRHESYYELKKKKHGQEVPVLDDIQRIPSSSKRDSQAAQAEAKQANGYVGARMVKTKLLYIFLWRYLNEEEGIAFGDIESDLENPRSTCRLFELNAAVKAMPLELYLQIIGSTEKSDILIEKRQKGLRLSDLPLQEYRYLMGTRAMGRLSRLIDILRRLQLIRLVNTKHRDDTATTLTHALELKPYIEEPVSTVVASYSGITFEDFRPHMRHDFVLSSIKAVEEYWSTLEYCYSCSDSEAALHAFPGSAVPEVFRFQAWCSSVRVISRDQRSELVKRVLVDDPCNKISFKECEEIAKDLNLSLEQVLRVYHNKRHHRMTKGEEISGNKRKRSDVQLSEDAFSKLSKKKESSFFTSSFVNACDLHQEHLDDDLMESSPKEDQNASKDENFPDMHQAESRKNNFSWTEAADRQLIIEYVRYRAALGPRFHRTKWASLSNLPSPPDYCKRRMANLNKSLLFRKAVMRLCNMLSDRYKKHLEIEGKWDDFNVDDIKIALGDTLSCKKRAKLDSSVIAKVVSDEESSSDGNDVSHPETDRTTRRRKLPARRSSFLHFPILTSKITGLGFKVFESIAISNAVELFKLIFLSTSTSQEASSSILAETLRRYSQHDLFAAFSYLREKTAMIGGTGSKPFALSQVFLQSVYLSPFPVNTGKNASNFASWLDEKEKETMEEKIDLPVDLQCGDIFYLCALVSSGELSMIPCLPEEGVGEVHKKHDSSDETIACESEISRREKGFPNIRLLLNRVTIPRLHALDTFKDKKYSTTNLIMHGEDIVGKIDIEIQNKSPWDAMSRYAEHLFSVIFDPEIFKSICLAIHKSGDQGLSMKEISKLLLDVTREKENEPELVVEVLETFGQTLKVNAFDSIKFISPLFRRKYFLTPAADENCQITYLHRDESISSDAVHRVTILNRPEVEGEEEPFGLCSGELRTYGSHILPWINGDGTRNELVYKGLTRRLLGIVMQNPGIIEDNIILKMNALNPQSCRELMKMMILDNHVTVRRMLQRVSVGPPSILSGLLKSPKEKSKLIYRNHFFANPMSTTLL